MKRIVIDIDNTLWPFCDVLKDKLQSVNNSTPPIEEWTDWDFWKTHISKSDFWNIINSIHQDQDNSGHLPYPEAENFLASLQSKGYHIIIASHRMAEYLEPTQRWLDMHGLVHDQIHLSLNKIEILDESCFAVVDDSPDILEGAKSKGLLATGLLFPWNRHFIDNGFKLHNNLNEVYNHIMLYESGIDRETNRNELQLR